MKIHRLSHELPTAERRVKDWHSFFSRQHGELSLGQVETQADMNRTEGGKKKVGTNSYSFKEQRSYFSDRRLFIMSKQQTIERGKARCRRTSEQTAFSLSLSFRRL